MKIEYPQAETGGTSPAIKKEQTRKEIAVKLLQFSSLIVALSIVGIFLLIGIGKLEPDKAVTFFLAVFGGYSGLLGSAIAYYFTSK